MQHFSALTTTFALALSGLLAQAQNPTVTNLNPGRNARAASPGTAVGVTFSQPVNPATANAIKIFSQQYRGQRAAAVSTSGSTVTLAPTAAFRPGETVFVTVPSAVQSTGGAGAVPQVYQFTAAAGGGTGSFAAGSEVPVGKAPYDVAVGDVDGDGDLDLLAANGDAGTVSARLNNGAGAFSGGTEVPVASGPGGMALADLDGDGDLDLLVACIGSNTVSVRMNNGGGIFSGTAEVPVGPGPINVAVGDLDGDGDLDFAVNSKNSSAGVSVRLNNGSGGFSGTTEVPVSDVPFDIALGDVDGDGDLDVLAPGYYNGKVSVRLNNGNGTFGGGTEVPVGANPSGVAVGDVDGDGDLDILTASNGIVRAVSVRFNNGSGSFSGTTEVSVDNAPGDVAVGDVDGDGDLDILALGFNSVGVRLNNGSGTFGGGTTVPVGNRTTQLAVGDVDGDGDLDVLTANLDDNTVSVRLNRSTAPVLTGINPTSAAVGASVTLTGTGLAGATSVRFNGTATSTFTSTSPTQVVLPVPNGATSGSVTVTTPAGTSNGVAFTVLTCPAATLAYGAASYCQSGANPTPTVMGPAGGTFSAPAGLSVDATTGVIALAASAPGTYTVTYDASTASCPTSAAAQVTVTSSPIAAFAYGAAAYCTNEATGTAPVLGSNATAGTFTASPAGLALNASTGAINFATSAPGTYTVTNTVAAAGGCAAVSATTQVRLNAAPAASIAAGGPTTFCQGGAVTLTASGGTSYVWSTGAITPSITVATSGTYGVTATNAAGCSAAAAGVAVTVNPAASAAFSYAASSYCQSGPNPTPDVTGTAGGVFSATAGLNIDPLTGTLHPSASAPGTYTVTYAVSGACGSASTQQVSISAAPGADFAYPMATYCVGAGATVTPTLGSGATAGTFSSSAGLALDPATGSISVAASSQGTYTVTNTVAASGGCAAASGTAQVTIEAAPVAGLTAGGPTSFCAGGSVVLAATPAAGATYQFLRDGQPIAGATAASYPATTGGSYAVTVTTASGCTATSAATTVAVDPLPATPALTAAPQANGAVLLTSSAATGNQFYLNGTAVAGATAPTYTVASAAQNGSYTVVTTAASGGGCASAPSAPVLVNITVTGTAQSVANSQLRAYPTPTPDGLLTVALDGYRRTVQLTVVNALGQAVYSGTVPAGQTSKVLNPGNLAAGVYLLHAQTDDGVVIRRFVRE